MKLKMTFNMKVKRMKTQTKVVTICKNNQSLKMEYITSVLIKIEINILVRKRKKIIYINNNKIKLNFLIPFISNHQLCLIILKNPQQLGRTIKKIMLIELKWSQLCLIRILREETLVRVPKRQVWYPLFLKIIRRNRLN